MSATGAISEGVVFLMVSCTFMLAIIDVAITLPRITTTDMEWKQLLVFKKPSTHDPDLDPDPDPDKARQDVQKSRLARIRDNLYKLTVEVNGKLLTTFVMMLIIFVATIFLLNKAVCYATRSKENSNFLKSLWDGLIHGRPLRFLIRIALLTIMLDTGLSSIMATDPRMLYLIILLMSVVLLVFSELIRSSDF
jgi:hypothetical protein